MKMLRKHLTDEVEKEGSSNIPSILPTKSIKRPDESRITDRISPKIDSSYSRGNSKTELKSPNLNDSKLSTLNHSPDNESVQSMPSPSQFLTVNKILFSIKAQLPEEYANQVKPKDTFADIEEGICNQTSEYPSTKHPATPPQFVEASKLVSAIKSKLEYKNSSKDGNQCIMHQSANERLQVFRASLSHEASFENKSEPEDPVQNSHSVVSFKRKWTDENMEVDEVKPVSVIG